MELARNRLVDYFRILSSLVLREMSARYGKKPGGYIWAFLDPVSHVVLLSLVFMAIAHMPALGTSFPLFFATGYIAFQFYGSTLAYINRSLSANRAMMSYSAIAPIDFVTARFVLQLFTTIVVSVVIFSVIAANLHFDLVLRWELILEAIALAALLGLGVGLFNSVMFPLSPLYEKTFLTVNRPVMLISGVFFLPDAIPQPYAELLSWNPICHAVMRFRSGFYDKYAPQMLDMEYLYMFASVAFVLGLFAFTLSRDVVRDR